jgi:ubiquitin carboxyl-terminal hydrolase 8
MCNGNVCYVLCDFRLIKSGDKLYQEAEKELVNKDEEKAYVFFMRFLELYKTIKKSPEYSKDKLYFDKMIGTQKIQTALTKCEQLSVSLDKRYRIMVEANKIDAQLKEDEMKDATENENNRINKSATKKGKISATSSSVVPGTNGVAKPPTASQINNEEMEMTEEERAKASSIHVNALKNLLEQKSTRFLMIDCRFYNDFINSHFLHPNCISIPSELLRPGYELIVLLSCRIGRLD